ncbi:MarR family transcriptional regulator [Paraferrimonas sp. SM1919]|uniref:MarR family transcriptional regulator n=1 Tax=Paraferrimonas sp. SM1919 TaxID=2662263 RepID=UPI0013D8BDEE|nr:MarR family transcriptional regulator [Paraferrimonas sp. SM1919]
MPVKQKPVAVISGDIVNSTKLTTAQFDELLLRIKDIQQWISLEHSFNAHSINRGDEYQSVVLNIEQALKYTILYRVAIKALGKDFDSRISFAIADNGQLRENVSESMGAAFIISGRSLKSMKNSRLVFNSDRIMFAERFQLLFKYLDRQLTELTPRQCQMLLPLLKTDSELSVNQLAEGFNISAAAVSKSLKASGWSLIKELLNHFKEQLERLTNV